MHESAQSPTHTHTHSLSLSLTHTHTHTHTLSLSLSLSLSISLTSIHTYNMFIPIFFFKCDNIYLSIYLSKSGPYCSHARVCSVTHTRTHTRTLFLFLTHTYTHGYIHDIIFMPIFFFQCDNIYLSIYLSMNLSLIHTVYMQKFAQSPTYTHTLSRAYIHTTLFFIPIYFFQYNINTFIYTRDPNRYYQFVP